MIDVHPSAIVEPGAWIGRGVTIGPFSYVGPKAYIGDKTRIVGSIIEGHVGSDCRIWRMAHVMAGAFVKNSVMLAQNVMIADAIVGSFTRIQNGTTVPHKAVIEDHVYIGAGVRLCNSVHPSASTTDELVPIVLLQGCSIGSNACIIGEVTIGKDAVVGAGAVVTRSVPDGATALGVPARIVP